MSSALDLLKKVGYTIVNWNNIIGKPSSFTPSPHKSTHATGGSDEITPADIGAIANLGSTPSIQSGTDASKPTAGTVGRLYIATDTYKIYRDNGTSWDVVGTVNWGDITGKPSSFTPSAHKSTHASGGSDPITPADIGAVNKAGDTMSGELKIQNNGGAILDIIGADHAYIEYYPRGVANRRKAYIGYPSANSTVFTIGQQDNGNVNVVVPTGYNLTVNGNTVWHAGNDGAESGLDADMVDGVHVTGSGSTGLRKITTSTSAPSGGSDGDIWIQYS